MRCTSSVSNNEPPLYGDAFADVYDEWYEHVTDAPATARALHALSGGGNLCELGIGTGRIAIPLAELLAPGRGVWGIDESDAMLAQCRTKLAHMNPSIASDSSMPHTLRPVARRWAKGMAIRPVPMPSSKRLPPPASACSARAVAGASVTCSYHSSYTSAKASP